MSTGRDTVQLRVHHVLDGRDAVSRSVVMTRARTGATAGALTATFGVAAASWVAIVGLGVLIVIARAPVPALTPLL
jgi:hypothetical protein